MMPQERAHRAARRRHARSTDAALTSALARGLGHDGGSPRIAAPRRRTSTGTGGAAAFETAEVGNELCKARYDREAPRLRKALLEAQARLAAADLSVVLIVSGVEGAGKSEVVNLLHEWRDARSLETHALWDETDEERERPSMWRFWRVLPARGRMGIFGPGTFFGEVAFLERKARTAHAVVRRDAELLVLDPDRLARLAAGRPREAIDVLHALSRELAGRLRAADVELQRLAGW